MALLLGSILQSNASHSIVTVFHDLLEDFQVFHLTEQEPWREGRKDKELSGFHSMQNDLGRKGKLTSCDDTLPMSVQHL